jgi:predicted transcriptional regulator
VSELHNQLSRRESQIMDAVYSLGEATAQEILERLPEPPSYSAVRALLTILEEKGHLIHRREGTRYIYQPTAAPEKVKQSVLAHLVKTFFGGSVPQVITELLSTGDLTQDELDELAHKIEQARKEGR